MGEMVSARYVVLVFEMNRIAAILGETGDDCVGGWLSD